MTKVTMPTPECHAALTGAISRTVYLWRNESKTRVIIAHLLIGICFAFGLAEPVAGLWKNEVAWRLAKHYGILFDEGSVVLSSYVICFLVGCFWDVVMDMIKAFFNRWMK